jgi:hypothetical protein
MKNLFALTLVVFFSFFIHESALAQNFDNPGEYMSFISKQQVDIAKKFLSYNSAISHGKRARKVENLRSKLLDEVQVAKENISGMPKYKDDGEYRDSAVSFMQLYYNILNHDFSKIVDLQEIAEQSYSGMEAWVLAKQEVNKKMKEANAELYGVEIKFATKYNVNLTNEKDDIGEKMEVVEQVNNYYDPIDLIFFKSYIQEKYLMDAVNKKNVNGIEQNKNSLLQYSQEGLTQLAAIKPFKGDNSLVTNAKAMLQSYVKECNNNVGTLSDYFLKTEEFDKVKTAYEQSSSHSKDDVNNYNKEVEDVNKASGNYNSTIQTLDATRNNLLDQWNNGVNTFFDNQMPVYK